TEGVGDHDPDVHAETCTQLRAQGARGGVGVLRKKEHGPRFDVGGIHPGGRHDQPLPGLDDSGLARTGDHAHRLGVDGLVTVGTQRPPLGLADDLGRDHEYVPIGQRGIEGVYGIGDQRGQVVAFAYLGQTFQTADTYFGAHVFSPDSSTARSTAARARASVVCGSLMYRGWERTSIPSTSTPASTSSTSQPSSRSEPRCSATAAALVSTPMADRQASAIPRTGAPPMMGETPTTVFSSMASRMPGTVKIDPTLTTGFDGGRTTTSASAIAVSTPGAGSAESAPTPTNCFAGRAAR